MEIQSQGTIFRVLNASPRRINFERITTKGALVTSEAAAQQYGSGCNGERKRCCTTGTSLNTMKEILLRSFQGTPKGKSIHFHIHGCGFTGTPPPRWCFGVIEAFGLERALRSPIQPHPSTITTSPRATSPRVGSTSEHRRPAMEMQRKAFGQRYPQNSAVQSTPICTHT